MEKCINAFQTYFGQKSYDHGKINDFCLSGLLDKEYIRPTAWKIFLKIYPIENDDIINFKNWMEITNSYRQEFKNHFKNITNLKKNSGDPLGNQNV